MKKFLDALRKTYHRNLLEKMLHRHRRLIAGEILDIGSKNRRYDALFRGNITAIDLIPNKELGIIEGNIAKGLDLPSENFDSILCLEVLEYTDGGPKSIQEIFRLLKTGGHAIITVPFMVRDHGDSIRFTEKFLRSRLDRFTSVEIIRIGNGFTVIWDILRQKILSVKFKFVKLLLFPLALPYYFGLKLFHLEKIVDGSYSGLFIILKK